MRVISARLAPLPPRRFFIPPLPSAFPAPHEYTYFGAFLGAVFLDGALAFLDLDFADMRVVLILENARLTPCTGGRFQGVGPGPVNRAAQFQKKVASRGEIGRAS